MKKFILLMLLSTLFCSCKKSGRLIIAEGDTIASLIIDKEKYKMVVSEKLDLENERQILALASKLQLEDYVIHDEMSHAWFIEVPVYIRKNSFTEGKDYQRKYVWIYHFYKDDTGLQKPVKYLDDRRKIKERQLMKKDFIDKTLQ